MSVTVRSGDLIRKDPDDTIVYRFDWDAENLPVGVTIDAEPTFTVTALSPSDEDEELDLVSTGTGLGVISPENRKVNFKLSGGTLGQRYQVACRIVTNELPPQTKDRSVDVLIEHQ